ncbi:uncharacterized protein MP3633_1257 [Marinomonas primoryensis]|uniref:Uncharacterized protein n=1 Tax=Marinomonas primoryensis TaxID=178399 RepID=A0A859CZW6_9GAMM|nr:uncharacterized protein MP3633_1257 [Marinomonas primoryensis]
MFIWWEINHQTLTLKRHKVAQLRRVELTSFGISNMENKDKGVMR